MLARERTSYLCPSLLDRWHLQCAAGVELDGDGGPGGLALRSLMGLWSPALALPGWVCLLVGVSARLECTTAELSASYPDPLATCLSPSPVLLRIGLLGRIYRCVACLLCGEASIDARTIEALGACREIWSDWHLQCAVCARYHLTRGWPSPWLLRSRCSYG
jgi:hypothetical protein